jgi:hypothetical protein
MKRTGLKRARPSPSHDAIVLTRALFVETAHVVIDPDEVDLVDQWTEERKKAAWDELVASRVRDEPQGPPSRPDAPASFDEPTVDSAL